MKILYFFKRLPPTVPTNQKFTSFTQENQVSTVKPELAYPCSGKYC
jgi:hypothetical protein